MRVHVGSKNQTKINAVAQSLQGHPEFENAEVVGVDVSVEEFGHPIGMEAVIKGAADRARAAFEGADLSFGIEGGLIEVPATKSGYMEMAACAIFDGRQIHLGLSSAYEWPKQVTDLIVSGEFDGSQALRQAGITQHEKIGTAQGGIWLLSNGKMDRTMYNKQAVMMALVHLLHPHHY